MNLQELLISDLPPGKDDFSLSYMDKVTFFWKYKGLLKERDRNNSFWSSTNENLKVAYEKLDEQEQLLEKAYNLNKKYLDNIKEGLLLINSDYTILNQYSQFLEGLFKTDEIAGKNLIDFIYPDISERHEDRKDLVFFLEILFKNTICDIDMIRDVNPLIKRRIMVGTPETGIEEKVISAGFTRIFEGEHVANIMVIFEDMTDIISMEEQLENEKHKHEAEVESISAILKAGPRSFIDFIEEASLTLDLFEYNIHKLDNQEVINKLFRQMHSLKASARYLELNYISSQANIIEDKLAVIKHNPNKNQEQAREEIKHLINELFRDFESIEKLNDKIQMFSTYFTTTGKANRSKLDYFFNSLKEMTQNISSELDKKINLTINNRLEDLPLLDKLKSPIIHLLRNSIDHGIEDSFERMTNHKTDTGSINLNLYQDCETYVIEIIDDGQGINFKKIKQKAIEKHYIEQNDIEISHSKLLNLIFSPNFSSKDTVSDISGRGYGLDVVKDAIKSLNGKISVSTREKKGTKITLKIPSLLDTTDIAGTLD